MRHREVRISTCSRRLRTRKRSSLATDVELSSMSSRFIWNGAIDPVSKTMSVRTGSSTCSLDVLLFLSIGRSTRPRWKLHYKCSVCVLHSYSIRRVLMTAISKLNTGRVSLDSRWSSTLMNLETSAPLRLRDMRRRNSKTEALMETVCCGCRWSSTLLNYWMRDDG